MSQKSDLILKSQFNLQSEKFTPRHTPQQQQQHIKSTKAPSQEIKFHHEHVSLVQSFMIIKFHKPKLILARPKKKYTILIQGYVIYFNVIYMIH